MMEAWENRWSEEDRREIKKRWETLLRHASDEVVALAKQAKGEGNLRSEKIAEIIREVAKEASIRRHGRAG